MPVWYLTRYIETCFSIEMKEERYEKPHKNLLNNYEILSSGNKTVAPGPKTLHRSPSDVMMMFPPGLHSRWLHSASWWWREHGNHSTYEGGVPLYTNKELQIKFYVLCIVRAGRQTEYLLKNILKIHGGMTGFASANSTRSSGLTEFLFVIHASPLKWSTGGPGCLRHRPHPPLPRAAHKKFNIRDQQYEQYLDFHSTGRSNYCITCVHIWTAEVKIGFRFWLFLV